MKNFLLRIGLFALLFLIIDQFFYFVVIKLPEKQIDKRIEKLINGKINANVIVLGSSRAAHNVLAEDLEKQTQLKSFNLGFRGSNISFHLFLLQKYLKHNKVPKKIIYVADVPFMFDEKALVFRNDVLLPFVKYSEYRNILIENNQLSKMAYFSNLAKFNFHTVTKKANVSIENFNTNLGSNPLPIENYKGKGDSFVENKKATISKNLIIQFKEIQAICNKNNIDFYLVIPPNNEPLNVNFVKTIENNLLSSSQLYVYKNNYTTKNHSYFYDISHLNKNGANIFTTEISTFINQDKN